MAWPINGNLIRCSSTHQYCPLYVLSTRLLYTVNYKISAPAFQGSLFQCFTLRLLLPLTLTLTTSRHTVTIFCTGKRNWCLNESPLSHKYKVHVCVWCASCSSRMVLYFYICPLPCLHFISFLVDFSILRVPSICPSYSFYDFICCHCHRTIVLSLLVSVALSTDSTTTVLLFFSVVVFLSLCRLDFSARFSQTKKRKRLEGSGVYSWWESATLLAGWQQSTTRAALHCFLTGQCTAALCIAIKVTL